MILEKINSPADVRKLTLKELPKLAKEVREYIIHSVSNTGGHLAPSLGATDIIIALHYCLNTPKDFIVWDVGHQAYAHKILTGRKDKFHTLRQKDGLSGFPNIYESEYDSFIVGHGSTSISTALGMVAARDVKGTDEQIVAFIGDGSLGGGMAFEGLNHAGQLQKNILIILNDNEFSISPSVGAFSKYLNRVITNPIYNKIRARMQDVVKRIPRVGTAALNAAKRLEESLKNILVPGIIFEEMGIRYFGPVDGHDIDALTSVLNNVLPMKEPRIIHVITKKGKGCNFAEKNPAKFHGTSAFNIETGELKSKSKPSFTSVFGDKLVDIAKKNENVVAITAAMPEGTGLSLFRKEFPERFFNVGMAEEHAVGFAAGLAKNGLIPVVAIYSTFMQRSYDQIIHDVALQNLHVVLCLDRGGVVGEDGYTHHGVFDIAYMRHIPDIVCMAPKDQKELEAMLDYAINNLKGPVSIRYPRGGLRESSCELPPTEHILNQSAELIRVGKDVAIFALGSMVLNALEASHALSEDNISAEVINPRFIKPLDEDLLIKVAKRVKMVVTVEDGVLLGGFGSAVMELFNQQGVEGVKVKRIGFPDKFIAHATRDELLSEYGLDTKGITASVREFLKNG